MKRPARVGREDLLQELSRLGDLSRDSLVQRWADLYGMPPPHRTSRSLLVRAVAYKMQERAYGELPPATRRMLVGKPGNSRDRKALRQVGSGTVLLREWRGATHQVIVGQEGVLYRSKHYRSLSEVARLITGTRWSGPAFFGVKKHDQG